METSSPLAAMHRSPIHTFNNRFGSVPEAPPAFPNLASIRDLPGYFNFRDISMNQAPQGDYFSMKPVRGSSPTALAADLSQNFHIDQSPQLPTPRRSLFSTKALSGLNGRGNVLPSTPPVPTSSSDPASTDSMDISPLPHKLPHTTVEVELQSPTPDVTPVEPSTVSQLWPVDQTAFKFPSPVPPQERRRSGPRRPSLSRAKGLSTSSIPMKLAPENPALPFKFGNGFGMQKTTMPVLSDLSEAFDTSPEQIKPPMRAGVMMGPPISRRPFAKFSNCSQNGSPSSGHVRKNSNPLLRPRKQFRRTLSMFEHAQDVVNQQPAEPLPPILDVDTAHVPQLPHVISQDECGSLPRITKSTLIDVLAGKYNHIYEKFVVIDCRFEYEYQGGHINGAVNFNDKEKLAAQLFDVEPTSNALMIFHCEYSVHRAPIIAKYIRQRDRQANVEQYPRLTYPETYILDGGYSSFFKDHTDKCYPKNYVEMGAHEHARECEKGLGKVKQRGKLIRAKTFAFGDSSPTMEDSPTAVGRARVDSVMDIDYSSNKPPNQPSFRRPSDPSKHPLTHRMCSY